jgi:hypothetical protein
VRTTIKDIRFDVARTTDGVVRINIYDASDVLTQTIDVGLRTARWLSEQLAIAATFNAPEPAHSAESPAPGSD